MMRGQDSLEAIIDDRDLITLDAIAEGCRAAGATYWKRDFILRGGTWRNAAVSGLVRRRDLIRDQVVVTGHSDKETGRFLQQLLLRLGARAVYAVNMAPRTRHSFSLPLGLTNSTTESLSHVVFGDQRHLELAYATSSRQGTFKGSVYANFNTATNPRERDGLVRLIAAARGFTIVEPETTENARVAFLANLREADFTLCPEGNGVDTHRLWETLYMGGYPIIRKNPVMSTLVQALPVLEVDTWEEVLDFGFLEEVWGRFNERTWDYSSLRCSHWIQQIRSAQSSSGIAD